MEPSICAHLSEITTLKLPADYLCEECVKANGTWVHLRTCQTCGVTLCCDASPSKHMTKHYHRKDHKVVISAEPGEKWLWCYKDELMVEYD
ncbi:MAG: UBP-type zinc finger domain-containing protein [Chitinophagaceae bacterium]|nr:UBP-type zinc finger domain-containing protein [Chitinophagaceae bacterium]